MVVGPVDARCTPSATRGAPDGAEALLVEARDSAMTWVRKARQFRRVRALLYEQVTKWYILFPKILNALEKSKEDGQETPTNKIHAYLYAERSTAVFVYLNLDLSEYASSRPRSHNARTDDDPAIPPGHPHPPVARGGLSARQGWRCERGEQAVEGGNGAGFLVVRIHLVISYRAG